jgi:hypothetical protein
MLTAAVLAAAEAGHTSKTAFYVLGAVLAACAVGLALVGISRPAFPKTKRGERGVQALFVLLVAGAMISAVATA